MAIEYRYHQFMYLKCPLKKKTTNQKHQLDAGYVDVQATHVICDLGQGLLTPRLGVNGAGPIQFLGDGRCPWTRRLLPILDETPPCMVPYIYIVCIYICDSVNSTLLLRRIVISNVAIMIAIAIVIIKVTMAIRVRREQICRYIVYVYIYIYIATKQ